MTTAATITATAFERVEGRRCVLVVEFTGDVVATATLDADGEVADITGRFAPGLYNALVEIAGEALADFNAGPGCRSVTYWTVTAAGEVSVAPALAA